MREELNYTADGTIWARDAMGRMYDNFTNEEAIIGVTMDANELIEHRIKRYADAIKKHGYTIKRIRLGKRQMGELEKSLLQTWQGFELSDDCPGGGGYSYLSVPLEIVGEDDCFEIVLDDI